MPPQAQLAMQELLRAGMPPIITVGEPGFHGPAGTGMQGIGVRTPSAAAVAAATCGFDNDWHMPNGGMFMFGTMSITLPAGAVP